MPELPDVTVYVEAIAARVVGQPLERIRLANPFILRTFTPPASRFFGAEVVSVERLGKRIVLGLEGPRADSTRAPAVSRPPGDLYAVIHLMVAGRFRWLERGAKIPGKIGLFAFDFPSGSLVLTEAGTKRRASLHLVEGRAAMLAFHAGGVEPLDASFAEFAAAIRKESHTLKRTMTDPRIFSGVGNAYSDEILHRARLSPVRLSLQLTDDEIARLHAATRDVLVAWTDRLRAEAKGGFPEKVTAFRDEMAVHGKYGKPCPVCGSPVQRIVYAENETNYCATCQTGGKLLADRSLSRLLRGDWPRTLEEQEAIKAASAVGPPASPGAAPAPPATPSPRRGGSKKKA